MPVKAPGHSDLSTLPRLIGQLTDLCIPEHRATLLHILEGLSKASRVPMMAPEPPADFVPRPTEFEALKRQLLAPETKDAVAITAALRGAGGYGKTTLARALAHDPDIEEAYFDGILWVELGSRAARACCRSSPISFRSLMASRAPWPPARPHALLSPRRSVTGASC